jgi:hypothetical protein
MQASDSAPPESEDRWHAGGQDHDPLARDYNIRLTRSRIGYERLGESEGDRQACLDRWTL